MRPLIGLSGRRWPAALLADHLPAAMHDAELDLHFTEYARATAAAGGLPVQLPWDAPADELVERLDGLVLSGGADVDPAHYGQPPAADLGHTEPARDHRELALARVALDAGVPILAICRGFQLINVLLGGTLVQHVGPDDGDGHPRFDEHRSNQCHSVVIEPGTTAAQLFGQRIEVNSLHHQILDRLGDGLVVSGRSDDGAVEAFELPGANVLGVQWHPEALGPHDPSFDWLVARSRERLRRRSLSDSSG